MKDLQQVRTSTSIGKGDTGIIQTTFIVIACNIEVMQKRWIDSELWVNFLNEHTTIPH